MCRLLLIVDDYLEIYLTEGPNRGSDAIKSVEIHKPEQPGMPDRLVYATISLLNARNEVLGTYGIDVSQKSPETKDVPVTDFQLEVPSSGCNGCARPVPDQAYAADNDRFVLRPSRQEAMCLGLVQEASDALIRLVDCPEDNLGPVVWRVSTEGQLVKRMSGELCMANVNNVLNLKDECTETYESFISIIPYGPMNINDGYDTEYQESEYLNKIFPLSGIHLFGQEVYSSFTVKFTNEVAISSSTRFTFRFAIDSFTGKKHKLCYKTGTSSSQNCFNLAGNAFIDQDLAKATNGGAYNKVHDRPGVLYRLPPLAATTGEILSSISFMQEVDSADAVQSRIYGFRVENSVSAQYHSRTKSSITISISFREAEQPVTTSNLRYSPRVLMQDEFGDYLTEVKSLKSKKIRLIENPQDGNFLVTIDRLQPGKRYWASLLPVDSSGTPHTDWRSEAGTSFIETTSCSCTDEGTGSPLNLSIVQVKGMIKMAFFENR